MTLLNKIILDLQPDAIRKTLRLPTDYDPKILQQLADSSRELIEARALYTIGYIEEKQAAAVKISGQQSEWSMECCGPEESPRCRHVR